MRGVGLQGLRDAGDQPVGAFAAECAVDIGEIEHTQQHQAAGGVAVFALHRGTQLRHEVAAVREAAGRVAVRLPAQALDLRRLALEHDPQARDHRVHRAGQPAQLGHLRLGDGQVLAALQRGGLLDRLVERPTDAADADPRQQAHHHADPCKRERGLQAGAPELVVRIGRLAHHLDRAERAPAVRDLRPPRLDRDRQQQREPGRCLQRLRCGLALEPQRAVGAGEADAAVKAGVELRRSGQLHQPALALLLRQHLRERSGVVAVLQPQLGLQRVAGRVRVHRDAGDEREQQGGEQQQPDLAYQRHVRLPSVVRRASVRVGVVVIVVIIETPRRGPSPAPRASARAARPGRRRLARPHPATGLRR